MLTALAIEGYRSIRSLRLALGRVTVVTGANGTGKSNLYRALRLLLAAGHDGAIAALALEGGLPSTLWAGPPLAARPPVGLRLGFAGDHFSYAIDFGLPGPSVNSMFNLDPEIKAEAIWHGPLLRPSALLTERRVTRVTVRQGELGVDVRSIAPWQSLLAEVDTPEVREVRAMFRRWRFFDQLRTDREAPARAGTAGTRTLVIAGDGANLAAALQTIREIGERDRLNAAIDEAFPGNRIRISNEAGRFELLLERPSLRRPLRTTELSDGTLRYLILVAALLSPQPADLLVLNEPETGLHPDLFRPLVRLLCSQPDDAQVLVVTHSSELVELLRDEGAGGVELELRDGETRVAGQGLLGSPAWRWPSRKG